MSARLRPPRNASVGFVPILLANLVPLAGVVRLGWDADTLVTTYTLELFLAVPVTALKTLFAQRPPRSDRDSNFISPSRELTRKRGSVVLSRWLPPVYPRTVPFIASLAVPMAWLAAFLVLALSEANALTAVFSRPTVVVSVLGLLVSQAIDTWRDYIRGGRYQETSPDTVAEQAARQTLFVVSLLLVLEGVTRESRPASITTVVLAVFVGGKLLTEWASYRASHDDAADTMGFTGWLAGPKQGPESTDGPDVPTAEPDTRVQTDSTAVAATAAFRTVDPKHGLFYFSVGFLFWLLSAGATANVTDSSLAVVGVTVAVAGGWVAFQFTKALAFYLEYGTLEYRRHGDRLVAYDTRLGELQWSAPVESIRNVTFLDTRFADHLFDTRTVRVTTGVGDDETERILGPVVDADSLVEAFDFPVAVTDPASFSLRTGATALLLAGAICVTLVVLTAGSLVPSAVILILWFLLPALLLAPWSVWRLAYSN